MHDISDGVLPAVRAWLQRRALLFRMGAIGFLGLLLLIPLSFVEATLHERAERRATAIAEITRVWGGPQHLVGPVLVVPYRHRVDTSGWVVRGDQRVFESSTRMETSEAFFLPESLEVEGTLETTERRRGIFRTDVYAAHIRLAGRFARPEFAFTGGTAVEPRWSEARVGFAITDLRGTRGALQVFWNGTAQPVEPGPLLPGLGSGVQAVVPWAEDAAGADFALELTLNGSGGLFVLPAGRTTRVQLASTWPDPSFAGAYLPTARRVGPDGFAASWEVAHYGRSVPAQWTNRSGATAPAADAFHESTFGVNLFEVVHAYRTIERAIKYGVLFIALIFSVFFLFEAFAGVRLNALNYLLVGAALCLFFLGLLALSEFLHFGLAYGLAASASVALIGGYSLHLLAAWRRAALIVGLLGGVYGYLYFVLHLEDFALLAGTAALFVITAALMVATRRGRALARELDGANTAPIRAS